MASFNRVLKNILWFCFVCLAVELVSARKIVSSDNDELPESPYSSLAAPKPTASKFEPISIKYPDTTRDAKEAKAYKEEKLSKVGPAARKEDDNLKMTGLSCARGLGSLYKVMTNDKKLLYEICFNEDRASAIYTTHIVDLAKKELERSAHGSFKSLYTLNGLGVNDKYHSGKQTERFIEKFGKGTTLSEAETKKMNYFSRNHLTPHADFSKVAEQELTYYYHNSVPGKQSMNQGNYGRVENAIRAIATDMKKTLRVYTGVYGILMKKDKDGNFVEVYLDGDKKRIEVPLVIWKLAIDPKTNDSVAFFTSNDTDMDEKEIKMFETLCDSVCDKLGYDFKREAKSGVTLCCSYADFAKHIQYLPFKLPKSNLLVNTVLLDKKNSKEIKIKLTNTSNLTRR